MKKLLLASAVAALSVTAAHAAPTVYGKAFLTLDYYNGDIASSERTQLNSNKSRIGFKGSEALTANTDLVYQLEYGVDIDADDNGDGQFYARDTYLGLANKQYGTLLAGRLTAIDDMVNYANVTAGGVLGGDNVLASVDGPRANNAFAYVSPSYNGLQFLGMYVMDENLGTDTLGRDAFGVGAKYEQGQLKAGASYLQAGDATKALRVSGSYDITPAVTVGALYQMTDVNTDDNENAITVSGSLKTSTPWTAYGQLDLVDNLGGSNNSETQRVVVGGKYGFNAATTGHVYGAFMQRDVGGSETDGFGVGAGIEYKF